MEKEYYSWGDVIELTCRIAVRQNQRCFIARQSWVVHAMKDYTGSSSAADGAKRIDCCAFRDEVFAYR